MSRVQVIDAYRSGDFIALAAYLQADPEPVVIAAWPEDIAHLALLMLTAPGVRMPTPTIAFNLLDLPLFDAGRLSVTPHNALSDATALKAYLIAEERLT